MKNFAKISILTLISSLLLTGCFGGDSEGEIQIGENQTLYENSEIAIGVPVDWEVYDHNNFNEKMSPSTIAAFSNNVKKTGFTAGLSINKRSFEEEISSGDFAKGTMNQARSALLDFEEIDSNKVGDGYLYTYQGRDSAQSPLLVYKQLFISTGNTGYVATGAYATDETESVVQSIDDMLDTFVVK